LDGLSIISTANGARQGPDGLQNYANTNSPACAAQAVPWREVHWQFNGPGIVMGQMYQVSLRVRGVVECKTYSGGTGPAKTAPGGTPSTTSTLNLWLTGHTDNGNQWNTLAFTTSPASNSSLRGIGPNQAAGPPANQTWVFNQCPATRSQEHYTWRVDGTQVIPVEGGQWINFIEYDTNCRMIVNCGASEAAQACPTDDNQAHKVEITGAEPPPPANLALAAQPPKNAAGARGQWFHIDVVNIQ
jgi:hypothetical protein